MNDELDRLGARVKNALDTEARQLSLAPHIRGAVMTAAARRRTAAGPLWFLMRRPALAAAAGLLVVLGAALLASRQAQPQPPVPYRQETWAEVLGGNEDDFWKRSYLEIRTRNGQEGHIRIEATWPRQKSVIALAKRSTS